MSFNRPVVRNRMYKPKVTQSNSTSCPAENPLLISSWATQIQKSSFFVPQSIARYSPIKLFNSCGSSSSGRLTRHLHLWADGDTGCILWVSRRSRTNQPNSCWWPFTIRWVKFTHFNDVSSRFCRTLTLQWNEQFVDMHVEKLDQNSSYQDQNLQPHGHVDRLGSFGQSVGMWWISIMNPPSV